MYITYINNKRSCARSGRIIVVSNENNMINPTTILPASGKNTKLVCRPEYSVLRHTNNMNVQRGELYLNMLWVSAIVKKTWGGGRRRGGSGRTIDRITYVSIIICFEICSCPCR